MKNKVMRDKMLKEAKDKKEVEVARELKEDHAQAKRIIEELAAEKQAAIVTKHKEREAAMKVIRDNQEEKKRLQ